MPGSLRAAARGLLAAVATLPVMAGEPADARLTTDIRAQSLATALDRLQLQTGLRIPRVDGAVQRIRSCAVSAGQSARSALATILCNAQLDFEIRPEGWVILSPRTVAGDAVSGGAPPVELEQILITGTRGNPQERGTGNARDDGAAGNRVVIFGDDAAGDGIIDVERALRSVTGTDFTALTNVGPANIYTTLTMHGVNDRHGNTLGFWIGYVPLPAVASNTFARGFPFLFDMESTEILRGPQPALLGANSQSGAIQFFPIRPDLSDRGGLVHSELALTRGGDPIYDVAAALDGPLREGRYGLRVTGRYRSEGGFVDRVDSIMAAPRTIVDRNANRATIKSARIALRGRPTQAIDFDAELYHQDTQVRDSSAFMLWTAPGHPEDPFSEPAKGRFFNGSLIRQPFSDSYWLGSLTGRIGFDGLSLQSVTGYIDRSAGVVSDDTQSMRWGGFGRDDYGPAYPLEQADLVQTQVTLRQHSFTQQIQLATDTDRKLSWILGAFYSGMRSREVDHVMAERLPPVYVGTPIALYQDAIDWQVPTTSLQRHIAGYGRVQYRSGNWMLVAGARLDRQILNARSEMPPQMLMPPDTPMRAHRDSTVFAPQLRLSHATEGRNRFSTHQYFFEIGRGYAPGNVEAARPTCREPMVSYQDDKLTSLQLGTVQGWRGGKSELRFTLFENRWDNGPTAVRTCLFMHLPGKARSRGFDLQARSRFGAGFEASLGASYVDARYLQTLRNDHEGALVITGATTVPDNSVIVSAGDAVGTPPQVTAPWTLTAAIEKTWQLGDGDLTLRLEDSWRSRNHGPFYTDHPEATIPARLDPDPASNLLNVRSTLTRGNWQWALYVENLLDARPVLSKRNKGNDLNTLYFATTLRPRTIGLSARLRFGAER